MKAVSLRTAHRRAASELGRKRFLGAGLAALTMVALTTMGFGLASSGAAVTSHAKQPYVFGLSYAQSGPLAPPAEGTQQFIQAWFSYVNAHGGVQGHKMELDTLDDTGDPGKALLNVETL